MPIFLELRNIVLHIFCICDIIENFSQKCNEQRAAICFFTSAFPEIDLAICWILKDLYEVIRRVTLKLHCFSFPAL